jgi:hypothetical protein
MTNPELSAVCACWRADAARPAGNAATARSAPPEDAPGWGRATTSCAIRLLLATGLVGCGALQALAQEAVPARGTHAVPTPHIDLRLPGTPARRAEREDTSPVRLGIAFGPAAAGALQEPLNALSAYAALRAGGSELQLSVSTAFPRPGALVGVGLNLLHRF